VDRRSGAAGSGWSHDKNTCRSHGRKDVTPWSSKNYERCCIVRWGEALHSTIHANNSNNQTMIWSIMHNTSTINMN
jgi:hypothetical protein